MRTIIRILLMLLIIASSLLLNSYAKEYQTAEESINDANSFLNDRLNMSNYYKMKISTTSINLKKELNLIHELAKQGPNSFSKKPLFVYGDKITASNETSSGKRSYYKVLENDLEYFNLGYKKETVLPFQTLTFLMIIRGIFLKIKDGYPNPGTQIKYINYMLKMEEPLIKILVL